MAGIRSVLDLIIEPGAVFEIRAITESGISSGYYDQGEKAEQDVLLLDADRTTTGIYLTLNTVNPDLLARRANRIKTRLSKKDATTADADIIRRRWFPIDVDPVRPSGVSSSDEEHENARATAAAIRTYLSGLGWPDPIVADSGNGAHLLYHLDLPNDPEIRDLVKEALTTLSVIFSDSRCQVDTANFNAARIWKVYGTLSRKGDNTPTRSHRRSAVTETPPEICDVTLEQLRSLATLFPKDEPVRQTRKRSASPLDLGTWLDSHGIGYEQKPYADGTIFILDECPFSPAHKDGAFAIQFASGGIFAGCHHNSCGSGTQRWPELREIYDGKRNGSGKPGPGGGGGSGASRRTEKVAILASARTTPSERDIRVQEEATRILSLRDPVQYIVDTFGEDHIGDQVVAHCCTMSFASRYAINSVGLHVSISGESGKGKSHAMSTMSALLPQDLASTNRMSDKALFYKTDLKAGSAICLDDQGLSDHMQEILKGVTTSFQKEFRYDTVNKDRAGMTLIIPERCVWWVAKVEGVGDDQVWNRMLSCWIDDSLEQDYAVMQNALKNAASRPHHAQGEREQVLVCREIWQQLRPVYVVIPYAERIRFSDTRNRRNVDMLLDLIHARAAMMQFQRATIEQAGYLCVAATVEDFWYAADLYTVLTGESGGQLTKMTRKEADVVSCIVRMNQTEFTIHDLQKQSGMSNSVINKILQGYQSRGNIYSGLLEKCPAISYCDRTRTIGDEVEKTSRRTKAFQWDMAAYKRWAGVGTVWLEDESGDPGDRDLRRPGSSAMIRETSADGTKEESSVDDDYSDNTQSTDLCCGNPHHEAPPCIPPDPHPITPLPPVSATEILDGPAPVNPPPIAEPEKNQGRGTGAEDDPPSAIPHPDTRGKDPFIVHPEEFKRLDIPLRGPCDRCNSRYVEYIEKVTKERTASRKNQPARRICTRCYEHAKRRESESIRTLPGVLHVAGMRPVFTDLGRCMICQLGRATWHDPENHVHICDSCYLTAGGILSAGGEACKT